MDIQLKMLYIRLLKDGYRIIKGFNWQGMYVVRLNSPKSKDRTSIDETYVLRVPIEFH